MPFERLADREQHWANLSWKFESILDGKEISKEDWMSCFPEVFQLLTSVNTDTLDEIHESLYSFFKKYLENLKAKICESEEDTLLRNYRYHWTTFRENLQQISKIFGNLLFEPYRSNCQLPSALYLPSLTSYPDDIQSDAEISSVYDIGILLWQNIIVTPMLPVLLPVLMKAINKSWSKNVCETGDSMGDDLENVIVDVALTFSQRPGELFNPVRDVEVQQGDQIQSMNVASSDPYKHLKMETEAKKENNGRQSPPAVFIASYRNSLEEYSSNPDIGKFDDAENTKDFSASLVTLNKFVESETRRFSKLFSSTLTNQMITLMEELFLGGTRQTIIRQFLLNAVVKNGFNNETATLFSLVSILPSGKKMALEVLSNYISSLSKTILENRPANVTSSPDTFITYFGGELLKLRNTVEETFSSKGIVEPLLGAVVQAAEDVLSQLAQERINAEDFTARYIDFVLKKTPGGDPENPEFLKKLDTFIGIFRYLTEKTLYQKYHAKLMNRRLVLGVSPSLEMERKVLRAMSDICSPEYCVYLNRTINEVEKCQEWNKEFALIKKQEGSSSTIKFSVLVLSEHIFPLGQAPISSFNFPQEFTKNIEDYTQFFSQVSCALFMLKL